MEGRLLVEGEGGWEFCVGRDPIVLVCQVFDVRGIQRE